MALVTAADLISWATKNNNSKYLHYMNSGLILYNDGTHVYTAYIDNAGNLSPVDLATFAIFQTLTP
jgi:hypothetical protein